MQSTVTPWVWTRDEQKGPFLPLRSLWCILEDRPAEVDNNMHDIWDRRRAGKRRCSKVLGVQYRRHSSGPGLYIEMLRGPRAGVKHTLSWRYSLCPFMPPPLGTLHTLSHAHMSAHSCTHTTDILGRRLTKAVDGSGMMKANPNTHLCI